MITGWVGGVQIGQNIYYVIFERSLRMNSCHVSDCCLLVVIWNLCWCCGDQTFWKWQRLLSRSASSIGFDSIISEYSSLSRCNLQGVIKCSFFHRATHTYPILATSIWTRNLPKCKLQKWKLKWLWAVILRTLQRHENVILFIKG